MRRRALLKRAAGVATTACLAGCSRFSSTDSSPTTTSRPPRVLDRVVLRADTEQEETVDLTLKRVTPDDDKRRPLWGGYTAPASGETAEITDFDGYPGVYSLTAHSREYNSVDTRVTDADSDDDPLQFEVVVQRHGAVWTNVAHSGRSVSIPGYSPDDTEP